MIPSEPIRVVIIAENSEAVQRWRPFVTSQQQMVLVGQAAASDEALQLCELVRPDAAVVALNAAELDGLSTVRTIAQRWPQIRLFVMVSETDPLQMEQALQAGAICCLPDSASSTEFTSLVLSEFKRDVLPPAPLPAPTPTPAPNQELEWAGRVQAGLIPEQPPAIPGWEFIASLDPARETSGDFYDFIPLPNGKWGIVIADVTDKGLGAAVFMALASSLIRTYAARYTTLPALALSSVNERILNDTRGSIFVTAFYAVLEPEIGRLRYVNAGHCPPVLLSSQKGKPVDRLGTTGPALGMQERAVWQQKIARFSPGDVLVLYTDGITEAHDAHGSLYGEWRLMELLRAQRGRPAQAIQQAVMADVRRFTADLPRSDDRAVVVLARR